MVGPLLLLKLFHGRRMKSKETSLDEELTGETPSPEHSSPTFYKSCKTEKDKNVCRVCLNEGTISIYGNDLLEDISEALNTFGDIDVRIDDPYTKFICEKCRSLLQSAILFRKTAQQSDEILKNTPTEEDVPDDNVDTKSDSIEESDNNILDIFVKQRHKISKHYCRKCRTSFESFEDLEIHRLADKHESKKCVCQYCHKTISVRYFKRHLTLHTHSTTCVCDICGKKFVLRASLQKHRLIHFYKLPYKCSICPYKGRSSTSLKVHMRSHTGERPYACTLCQARFTCNSNLNKHLLIHKAEPDFKCDTCRKRFHSKSELNIHYKAEHTGVLEHICKLCDKTFMYRKQLTQHERRVHKRAKLRAGIMPVYLKVQNMEQQGENIVTES